MSVASKDLWSLALDHHQIDPADLAEAIVDQVESGDLDFRTRLLIRDGLNALEDYWGRTRLQDWLGACPIRQAIQAIWNEDLGKTGFRFLKGQLMEITKPEEVRQMLQELGDRLHGPVTIQIAGSIALILKNYLSRQTTDVDIVNEVPKEIRSLGDFLKRLEKRYRLDLGHVQSHYLPQGWEQRIHGLGPFGKLRVYLVDRYDVGLSKLFSDREKDLDDLRFLLPQLDKELLVHKLRETCGGFLASPIEREKAVNNWRILFQEPLPA